MAQAHGRAAGATHRRRRQQRVRTDDVVVVASHLYHLVDRYIAAQRMVLARFPEYGTATGRAAFGARLDQLEALIRDASADRDAAARS
jgi:hypothetical protein